MERALLCVLAMLTLAAPFSPPAAAAGRAGVVLRGGPTIPANDPGGAYAVAAAVAFEPRTAPAWFRYLGDTVRYELTAGRFLDAGTGDSDLDFVRGGVAWRYAPSALPERSFVELGPALTVRSGDRVNGTDQGGEWFLTGQVTLGMHVGASRRGRLAVRWQHTSNANTDYPNPGINLLLLEVGYGWGS